MSRLALSFALAGLLTVGCKTPSPILPPKPQPFTPSDRDSPDTIHGRICTHLRELGCPEGFPNRRGRTCFESLSSAATVAMVPELCLSDATTPEAVRKCGNANTLRVRCDLPSVDRSGSALE
jgi:hypothetical protein